MNLAREERETIVRTSDADDFWLISTASPKFIRKFTKLGYMIDDTTTTPGEYKSFRVPINLVSFRRPRKKPSEGKIAARTKGFRRAQVVS
jgi:hypothetical protein